MRLLICAPMLLAACSVDSDDRALESSESPELSGPAIQVVGKLENAKLDEVSGIAQSSHNADQLWVINDSGPAAVHSIDLSGKERARIKIDGAENVDWEDLASFTFDGKAYLVVADIGDNDARREHVTLYVIAEPERATNDDSEIAWRIDFRYPDGPRDAEALAVDATGERFYVLSKRDSPAVLYAVPLLSDENVVLVAERLTTLTSLPQPSKREFKDAAGSGYYWQPTAMDISADGRSALVLTYRGVYFFSRAEQQTWHEALDAEAMELKLGKIKDAESLAFDSSGQAAFLTIEKKRAPLMKIDLSTALGRDLKKCCENTTQ
ncbi:MAG: hypothetical protein ACR2QT_08510 [Woeseiaceae bacterium]